jgi:hypothetical protein
MTSLQKHILSLLLVNNKLAAEDISSDTKIDLLIITHQLLQLCRKDYVTVDRSHPQAQYSINELHIDKIIEYVRQIEKEE